jgi:hypothetical protein
MALEILCRQDGRRNPKLIDDLAAADACISDCRDKVRHANAVYFRAKKNNEEKELIASCEQRVKEAMLTLEENLKARDRLRAQLPKPATLVRDAELLAPWWMAI